MDARITGLAGVIVWTSSEGFDEMATFYRDVLELTPRSQRAGFINFEWGDTRLTVAVHAAVSGQARDPLRVMVNLSTNDLVGLHGRLSSRGVSFIREPERESWGGLVATTSDPDGNTLQLLQLP